MAAWFDTLGSTLSRRGAELWAAVIDPKPRADAAEAIVVSARVTAPIVWLLGKVQSGKTSIVRTLTQCSDAEIGNGYRACTRTARVFDFPADAPVIRFLDTRGLGEASYDPAEDIAFSEGQAHLLLVVMRALDPQQEAILDVVRSARQRHPDWPVIVAQTTLHDAYPPGTRHSEPYPYEGEIAALAGNPAIPADLIRSLAYQRRLFDGLPGRAPIRFVALDFTLESDGLQPADYGIGALMAALREAAPAGLAASLRRANAGMSDARADQAHPHIVGYAAAAGAADLVPLAGLVAVPAIQGKMLHSLGQLYEAAWDRRRLTEFAGCLGAGALIRILASLGIRQAVKLVPVFGQTAGAAAAAATAFATTFALGKAAVLFLALARAGRHDPESVARTYGEALGRAFDLAKARGFGGRAGAPG